MIPTPPPLENPWRRRYAEIGRNVSINRTLKMQKIRSKDQIVQLHSQCSTSSITIISLDNISLFIWLSHSLFTWRWENRHKIRGKERKNIITRVLYCTEILQFWDNAQSSAHLSSRQPRQTYFRLLVLHQCTMMGNYALISVVPYPLIPIDNDYRTL